LFPLAIAVAAATAGRADDREQLAQATATPRPAVQPRDGTALAPGLPYSRAMRALVCTLALAACARPPQGVAAPDAPGDVAVTPDAAPPLPRCTSPGPATFRFDPTAVVAKDLVGFGAQFNNNAYAQISLDAGITAQNVTEMEAKTTALAPKHVRIFFNSTASADEAASFEKVVALAQTAGASINITYWHGPYPDPAGQMQTFANELVHLIHDQGLDAVRYVTIQNEVNSTMVTMPLYEQLYRTLDADLRAAGVRDHVKFVCGDLLRTNQAAWFDYLATHMADVCDGYSIHIYWQYNDVAYMVTRLTEVHDIVAAMPAAARKPLYVTEFGIRGDSPNGEAQPGLYSDGQLLGRTNENGFQHAWFEILATRLGYVSTLKWDAFFAKYDNGEQYFSSIGIPPQWTLKPVYYATQLLDEVAPPGWSSVQITGGTGSADARLVTGFAGSNGDATVVALNKAQTPNTVDVTGLPPGTRMQVRIWHGEGDGTTTTTTVTSSDACQASVTVPARSVAAITTLP
jgi:hypothetical protein